MKINNLIILLSFIFLISSCKSDFSQQNIDVSGESIRNRIKSPPGYIRENYDEFSWQYFLQNLNLLPSGSKILDYKGNPINSQSSHIGIIDYDIGTKDLQQCADAIIRLRAEYLFMKEAFHEIQFKFTSGHNYKWLDHAKGLRPKVSGNKVTFKKSAKANNGYANFRNYLDIVFTYAGTISLNRDLESRSRNKGYYN